MGSIVSVNVAQVRTLERRGRRVNTGIWKLPVEGPVAARALGLDGDVQGNRRVHGGADKALYAYAREDLDWWEQELARALAPGTMGENLTVEGVDVTGALVGERWRAGEALVEVSEPRFPCWKLAAKMQDAGFQKRFAAAGRPGAYLRVIEEGSVAVGDPVEIVKRPGHDVSLALFAAAYLRDHALAARLLTAPALSAEWRGWAEARAA